MNTDIKDITSLLHQVRNGSDTAENKLMNLVYSDLKNIARKCMAGERPDNTLQPTALIHEAYMKIFGGASVDWRDRAHFFAIAASQMNRVLVDHGREFRAQKRGSGLKVVLDENMAGAAKSFDATVINEVIERLQKRDPGAAKVVQLKFFAGLGDQEVAEALKTSHSTVRRQWSFAKAWLAKELAAS